MNFGHSCLSVLTLAGLLIGIGTANAAQSSSFGCGDLDGTPVRDGEYFFPGDCSSSDNKRCRCEMTNDEPPTNTNCEEITVSSHKGSSYSFARSDFAEFSLADSGLASLGLADAEPARHKRDYTCHCTIGPGGERGVRCGIIILPR